VGAPSNISLGGLNQRAPSLGEPQRHSRLKENRCVPGAVRAYYSTKNLNPLFERTFGVGAGPYRGDRPSHCEDWIMIRIPSWSRGTSQLSRCLGQIAHAKHQSALTVNKL